MNRGTIGFLMNAYGEDDLPARLRRAEEVRLHPLAMTVRRRTAANIAPWRSTKCRCCAKPANRHICAFPVDGAVRMLDLVCDGALVATPAGSTAYNFRRMAPSYRSAPVFWH